MIIRQFNLDSDLLNVYNFYNVNCLQIGYVPFATLEEFNNKIIKDKAFNSKGMFLALDKEKLVGLSLGVIKNELLANETYENTPGFICMLFVDKFYQRQGIGKILLTKTIEYLHLNNRKTILFSHKCPIKFSWNIDGYGAQHNKAPGVKTNTFGYQFLLGNDFKAVNNEISYYLDLDKFNFNDDMKKIKDVLKEQGYTIGYYDNNIHSGYDDMFTRLNDESYRKKFKDDIQNGSSILVALKDNKIVCGCTGAIYPESNGRGYFQGLAVDPSHSGKKLGAILFFTLCKELKEQGAKYMTLFVSENNFARKIYERAGFVKVEKWTIMKLRGYNKSE